MPAPVRFPGWPARDALRVALLLAAMALAITASGLLVRVDHLVFDFGQRISWRQAALDVMVDHILNKQTGHNTAGIFGTNGISRCETNWCRLR